jgi:phytanoyl-CoA hydroxylase
MTANARLRDEDAQQLFANAGFAVLRAILQRSEVEQYRALSQGILKRQADESYQQAHRSIGSLFDLLEEPAFVDLIGSRAILDALGRLGCTDPRFEHGIVFNKLPGTPRTFWHQDGTTWGHASAYTSALSELIAIVYLGDTSAANGCLRVIPGSHRRRHPLHGYLASVSTPELRRGIDSQDPAYQTYPEEIDVPVCAGDLVVLDARLLHAAHANTSSRSRTALSLWYVADPAKLPECVLARFDRRAQPNGRLPYLPGHWPAEALTRLEALLPPEYSGREVPLPMQNTPGKGF